MNGVVTAGGVPLDGGVTFTAVACRFDGRWETYVLDPDEGLVGMIEVASFAEIEHTVKVYLAGRFRGRVEDYEVEVVRR